ncbi:hypothetical protein Bca101_025517 [Brassica carinata]
MAFLFPEEELDSNPAPILSSASHTAVSQPSSLKFNMSPASPLGTMSPPPFVSTPESHINAAVHCLKG